MSEKDHKITYKEELHHEHVVPLSYGGGYNKFNIVPACRKCNCSKGGKNLEQWYNQCSFFNSDRLKK